MVRRALTDYLEEGDRGLFAVLQLIGDGLLIVGSIVQSAGKEQALLKMIGSKSETKPFPP